MRGDTLIEVLLATTVFGLIVVGGLGVMSRSISIAQRSMEITLVRQQIDAQADALRFLNRAYIAGSGKGVQLWQAVAKDHEVEATKDFNSIADNNRCNIPNAIDKPFAINVNQLSTAPLLAPTTDTSTYARVRQTDKGEARAEGIWIQAVKGNFRSGEPGYYDFHIRACWFSPGDLRPVTLGTIVRLYEPQQ